MTSPLVTNTTTSDIMGKGIARFKVPLEPSDDPNSLISPTFDFSAFGTDYLQSESGPWERRFRHQLNRSLRRHLPWASSSVIFTMNENNVPGQSADGDHHQMMTMNSAHMFKQEWQRLHQVTSDPLVGPGMLSSSVPAQASSTFSAPFLTSEASHPPFVPCAVEASVPLLSSRSIGETIELLLFYYREHGPARGAEELKSLVELFISQVIQPLKVASDGNNGSDSSLAAQTMMTSSSSSTPSSSCVAYAFSSSPAVPCSSSSLSATCLSGSSRTEVEVEVMQGDDLSCPVCYGVLVDPVTIVCGHSYCKKCLQTETVGNFCRRCRHVLLTSDVANGKTNVLIGSLVEKWWSKEVKATKLRNEGNFLFDLNQVSLALDKYTQALELAAEDHLSLGSRSHALLTAGRSEEALQDAEVATRCCPAWPKGYFRKSAALISLGRYEEAFLSLSVCMFLIRSSEEEQEEKTQVVTEMTKILNKLFLQTSPVTVGPTHKRHATEQLQFTPYPKVAARGDRSRVVPPQWGDAEFNSNVDDDPQLHVGCFNQRSASFSKLTSWKAPRVTQADQLRGRINQLFSRASQDLEYFELRVKGLNKNIRLVHPSLISCNDLECSLCYRLLFQPVSTGCGHTFCRSCLDRCLDHNPLCPLCKTSLEDYLASRDHAVTDFLESAIRVYLPTEREDRLNQHLEELNAVPSEGKSSDIDVPIFVCTMAFPTIPCPLHVFEPRYRLMIRRCMENGSNRFGMCCYLADGERNYGEIGTLVEIRNIQYFADGRSVVDTVGFRRFRVVRKSIVDGYNAARIELLYDQPIEESEIPAVLDLHDKVFKEAAQWLQSVGQVRRQRIYSHFGLMPSPEEDYLGSPDGPSWIWWLLAILPLDSKAQLAILSMSSLHKRLECLLKVLNFVKSRMNLLGE